MSKPHRLLTFAEVQSRVRLSRTTIWRLERDCKFPPRIRVSPGRVAWRESDIDAFVAGHWLPNTDAA
jgi:prophage regulatory protein